jgi:hypothetical protein
MSVKQRHKYVCFNGRKTWINVNDSSETCDYIKRQNESEECALFVQAYSLIGMSLGKKTNVDEDHMQVQDLMSAYSCF